MKLVLPRDEKFSIALAPAEHRNGLDGVAQSDAKAARDGTAEAAADVTGSGTASAGFQLGHSFRNDTDRQTDFEFDVRLRYAYDASSDPPGGAPHATISLALYARDGRNRLLREQTLTSATTESGPVRRSTSDEVRFSVTLGPGESVSVYVAGRAAVAVSDGHSARGSLKIDGIEMEVSTRPAPAIRTAAHEQR
jgi:hypothetical protein